MKTKSVSILFGIFFIISALAFLLNIYIISVFAFMGCNLSARPTPTEEHIIEMARKWGVPFPEDVTILNYALSAGMQDGQWFYVLEYKGNDENFINYLSGEKENIVSKVFEQKSESLKKVFNKPFTMPDLSEGYYWLYKGKGDEFLIDDKFYMLYLPSINQILIYHSKI